MSADDVLAGKSYWSFDGLYDFSTDCGWHLPADVTLSFFPYVPTFQDVCVAYYSRRAGHIAGTSFGSMPYNSKLMLTSMRWQPYILVNDNHADPKSVDGPYADYFLHLRTTFHDLCHDRQFWYSTTFYNTYESVGNREGGWYNTQAGRESVALVGAKRDEERGWVLEAGNRYRVGRDSPLELAAIVCSDYVLHEIFMKHLHPEYYKPTTAEGHWRTILLTLETIEWMEKWYIVD